MAKPRGLPEANPREDAAQLRFITDNMPTMSVAYDENLHCVFANRRFAEFFGLTTVSVVGKHLREIIGEGPYQEVKPYFDRVIEGHRATYERTRVLDSGELRYLEVELIPHIGQDGCTRGLFAVTTDVTERKRAEEQLRDANEQLQMLIQSSPLAIYTRDRDGLLTSWNPAAEKMYGWKAAELLGKPLPSVPDEVRAESDGLRMRLLAGEPTIKHEARRRRRDGSLIDIDAFLAPLHDASGNITGIIAVVADITARKRAQETQARLAAIVDSSNDAIVGRSLDRKILSWNAAAERLFGYTAAEVIGQDISLLIPPDREQESVRSRSGSATSPRSRACLSAHPW